MNIGDSNHLLNGMSIAELIGERDKAQSELKEYRLLNSKLKEKL